MTAKCDREEGEIYSNDYLTSDLVPFSPAYEGDKYRYGCNPWDISIGTYGFHLSQN